MTNRSADRRLGRTAAVSVLIIAFSAFVSSLRGEFVWDDVILISENKANLGWGRLAEFFTRDFFARHEHDLAYGYYRPIITLSYLIDLTVFGAHPFGFHLSNTLLHALASVMVLRVVVRIGWSLKAGWLTAVLFAVHPIHIENVAWISGRTDVVAFLFSLVALELHLAAHEKWAGANRTRLALSLVAFAVALLAKEMSVVLVAWLVLIDRSVHGLDLRSVLKRVAPYIAIVALYCVWRHGIIDVPVPLQAYPEHSLATVALSAPHTLVRYLAWLASPLHPRPYVQNPYVLSAADPRFVGSLALLAGGFILWWRFSRTASQTTLGLSLLFVSFGPLLNVVRISGPGDMGIVMAERFCYFPSFPFVALVAAAVETLALAPSVLLRRLTLGAATAALATCAVTTVIRNRIWHDGEALFTTALERSPDAPLLWCNLASYRVQRLDLEGTAEALGHVDGVALDDIQTVRDSIEVVRMVHEGRYRDAVPFQERITARVTHGSHCARNNLAFLYLKTGRESEAGRILESIIRVDPNYTEPHLNLAQLHESEGRIREAREEYGRALELTPDSHSTVVALAQLEIRSGQFDRAAGLLKRALHEDPDDRNSAHNLALIKRLITQPRNP